MNFQPVVPISGIGGYLFLERTRASQQAVFDQSPQLSRQMDYFRENIANATTAEALVNDRVLREVALGAFGLDEDIDKRFFIQKILEEGTDDPRSLSNRLVDPRYREFASTFGYGNILGSQVQQSDFADRILNAFKERQFEIAVGNSDNSLRLAMNFTREIGKLLPETAEIDEAGTSWFRIMGNTPVRTVFETAFGLPTSIGSLDIDRQKEIFEDKLDQLFGTRSVSTFADPENVDRLVREFLVRDQINNGPSATTPGFGALTLLNNTGLGASGAANLLLSNIST